MVNRSSFRQPGKQAGLTTIQLMIFIAVLGIAQLGQMEYQTRMLSKARGKTIGGMQAVIRDAMDDYLKSWNAQITSGKPVTGGGVTVNNVLRPTLAELTALGHLHAAITSPPHGGTWEILVEPFPASCTIPGPCNLATSVWASDPLLKAGSTTLLDQIAIDAAVNEIGANGGYSEASNPSTIIGLGGWTRANKNGSVAGTLMSIGGYGSSSYTALVNTGDSCVTRGAVATSTTGQQMICRGSPLVYVPTVNALPSYATKGLKATVKDGDVIPKPTCDVGGVPAYSYEMNQTAVDVAVIPPLQAQYVSVDDLGASWRVKLRLKDRNTTEVSGNTYNITAVMHIECYYQ